MQPPSSSSPQRGDGLQKTVCAQRGHDAALPVATGHLSDSSMHVARATGAAETATPSTSRVLLEPSRPRGPKRQAPATCQCLQLRCGVDTLPAIGRLEVARRVTSTDWFRPLRALQRQRQTAAEAYTPFTIAAAEAEDAPRSRLPLDTIPLDLSCRETKCADDLSASRLSSAKAHRDVDAVMPTQNRLSDTACLHRKFFVATEPPPRRLLTHEPRSRLSQGGGSCFSPTFPTTSRCGSTVHTGAKDGVADTLAVKVDAVTAARATPAHMPALETTSDSDEHLRSISRQYARLDRVLRGYSTPDNDDIVASYVTLEETPAARPHELASSCLYPPQPPSTSVVRLVLQPSVSLSRRSSLSLGAPFTSFHITPTVQLTRLSETQAQRLPSFVSLTAATSGAATAPLAGANNSLHHFRTRPPLPQHPHHLHSASSQELPNSHSEHHRPSTRTPPYTHRDDARFPGHCACMMERHLHNLIHHEQHQRTHITTASHRALSTVHGLHKQYCAYTSDAPRGQRLTFTTAFNLDDASRHFPIYPSDKPDSTCTDTHPDHQSNYFTDANLRHNPDTATHAAAPQEAYEDVDATAHAAAPQEAYEDVDATAHTAAPQEAYEDVDATAHAAAPQEAYEDVDETAHAAAPQEAYEDVDATAHAAAPQEALEKSLDVVGSGFFVGFDTHACDDDDFMMTTDSSGRGENGRGIDDGELKKGYRCGVPEVTLNEWGSVAGVFAAFTDLTRDVCAGESGVGEVFTDVCGLWRAVVTSSEHVLRGPNWRQHLMLCAPRIRELVVADVSATLECSAACVRNVRLYAAGAAAESFGKAARDRVEEDILRIELDVIQEATVALHPLGGVQFLLDGCSFPYLQQWRRSRDELKCMGEGESQGALSSLSKVAALCTNMEGDVRTGGARGAELQLWAYSTKGVAARSRGCSVVKRLPLPSERVVYQPERRSSSEGSQGSLTHLEQEKVLSGSTYGASSGRLAEWVVRREVHACKPPASVQAAPGLLSMQPVGSMPLQTATPSGIEEIIKQEKEKACNLIAPRPLTTLPTVPAETSAMTSQPSEMAGVPKEAVQKAKSRTSFSSWKRKHT